MLARRPPALREAPGVPTEDAREVSDYVAALDHGLKRLRGGFPLSLRLIREAQGVLLRSGKVATNRLASSDAAGSGSVARARATRASSHRLRAALSSAWARWRSSCTERRRRPSSRPASRTCSPRPSTRSSTVTAGSTGCSSVPPHGRGRALRAHLYLSLHFKTHRHEFYDHLQRVARTGTGGWLRFFLQGVVETAERGARHHAPDPRALRQGPAPASALRVLEHLEKRPIAGVQEMAKELTGYKRNRVFACAPYVEILSEGTDPIR